MGIMFKLVLTVCAAQLNVSDHVCSPQKKPFIWLFCNAYNCVILGLTLQRVELILCFASALSGARNASLTGAVVRGFLSASGLFKCLAEGMFGPRHGLAAVEGITERSSVCHIASISEATAISSKTARQKA